MIAAERLKAFFPFKALSAEGLRRAAEACREVALPAGRTLFRRGDVDREAYFLLRGEVELRVDAGTSVPLSVAADSEAALHPLARLKPRRYTAVARTPVTLLGVDEDRLDQLLTIDQTAAYEVTELSGDDPEWMFMLAGLPIFQKVPATNLASLFANLERVPVRRGQTIIRQDEAGDHYYLIREGRAEVVRSVADGRKALLALLGRGDAFGEEALLSGYPRNATVNMLSDGILMRLSGEAFDAILRPPLLQWVEPRQVLAQQDGAATLVDVRLEDEFAGGSLPGSINIPLYLLRLKARSLDPRCNYIFFCNTDRRACVAAFLMSQRGFDASVLRGGLEALDAAQMA